MITQQELKDHVIYNKVTGEFISKKTGKIATRPERRKSGYVIMRLKINNVNYYAGRMAVLYVTGRYPEGFVKTHNGDQTDLRWKNLRFKLQDFYKPTECAVKEVIELSLLQKFWRWVNGQV